MGGFRRSFLVLGLAAALIALWAVGAGAGERRAENTIYGEGLGPGFFWSLNYERMLIDDLGVRLGFGYVSVEASAGSSSSKSNFLSIPLTVSYTGLGNLRHSLEVLAGVTMTYVSGSASTMGMSASGSGVTAFGNVGLGYRFHPVDTGFHFRVGLGGLVGKGMSISTNPDPNAIGFLPWGYISFGVTFGFGGSDTPAAAPAPAPAPAPTAAEPVAAAPAAAASAPAPVAAAPAPDEESVEAPVEDVEEEGGGGDMPLPDEEAPAPAPKAPKAKALAILPKIIDFAGERSEFKFEKSNADKVVDTLDMPKTMREDEGGPVLVYEGNPKLPGCQRVVFRFDDERLLKEVEVTLAGPVSAAQVRARYGSPDRTAPSGGTVAMVYKKAGMTIYLRNDVVQAIRLRPGK